MKLSRQIIKVACLCALLIIAAVASFILLWPHIKVPFLIQSFRHGTASMRAHAAISLARSDASSEMLVPVLLPGLKDSSEYVRGMTEIALGNILHQYPETVVPALLDCIKAETNSRVSLVPMWGFSAIGHFGTNAKPWSPIVYEMIVSNGFNTWPRDGLDALEKINPEMAKPLRDKRELDSSNALWQAQMRYASKHATNMQPANPKP